MKRYLFYFATLFIAIALTFSSCTNTGDQNKRSRESGRMKSAGNSETESDSIHQIVFDDFEPVGGFEVGDWNHRRIIRLIKGLNTGHLDEYLFDNPAKYDATLYFIDESRGRSKIDLLVNDKKIGTFGSDVNNPGKGISKEITMPDINIQKWSKLTLEFYGEGDPKCLVEKLVLTPKGSFEGKQEKLKKPIDLNIFETAEEKLYARRNFSDFVRFHTDSVEKKRLSDLSLLKTPAEWKKRQQETRENLRNFIGEFPDKTPLNARITGTLDRPKYKIEKVIFESQPKYYVTANIYIPKGRKFPVPGVLLTCGHDENGKGTDLYHEACLGLVLKGYVVLAFDPMGQGERSEYIDPVTKKNLVGFNVSQHHYIGKPSMLVDWTLAGLRIWDGIRAVDYLVSRPEVNKDKLAVIGNSGGGEMTLLITAVDERIKVCAASHPGGSMEETYLLGGKVINREIFSLIPPRPCRINVGRDSGEENGHRAKIEDMQLFYEGLGYSKDRAELVVVDGVHDMKQPKREASYEWLNKWFDKEAEGKAEPALKPEKVETLWCTESGSTLVSLGGETGQTLNAKRADKIYQPAKDPAVLKQRIATRIGFQLPQNSKAPIVDPVETLNIEGLSIEKFTYESEKGIIIPALLIKPRRLKAGSPVYIYASDKGKPKRFEGSSLPFLLAKNGSAVLAIDVRGIGETSPTPSLSLDRYKSYNVLQWIHDVLANHSASFGRTTLGMRTLDLIAGIDFIKSQDDLKDRKLVLIGEGMGGLWGLVAAVYDLRAEGVISIGTLPSYMKLVKNQYYSLQNYFWVPGALRDFDIPDLAKLVAPKPQIWIDPINEVEEKLGASEASSIIGSYKNLQIVTPKTRPAGDILNLFSAAFLN